MSELFENESEETEDLSAEEVEEETEVVEEEGDEEVEEEAEPTTGWWNEFGFESEADARASATKVKNLRAWESDVNRQAMANAEARKQPAQPAQPTTEPEDPYDGIDPESAARLRRIIDAEVNRRIAPFGADVEAVKAESQAAWATQAEMTLDNFVRENGVDRDQVIEVMNLYNLWPATSDMASFVSQLGGAAAIVRAQNLPNVEAEAEARAAQKAAERAASGQKVVAVKPAKQTTEDKEVNEMAEYNQPDGFWNILKKRSSEG